MPPTGPPAVPPAAPPTGARPAAPPPGPPPCGVRTASSPVPRSPPAGRNRYTAPASGTRSPVSVCCSTPMPVIVTGRVAEWSACVD
ncbi:hypothetical protein CXF30_09750 [Corynebacterium bovis]|nr:hypothetical protein CXF30_09750 [Corynebacterium bovis]